MRATKTHQWKAEVIVVGEAMNLSPKVFLKAFPWLSGTCLV